MTVILSESIFMFFIFVLTFSALRHDSIPEGELSGTFLSPGKRQRSAVPKLALLDEEGDIEV